MDFSFTKEEETFRRELVEFIKTEVPPHYLLHDRWDGPPEWEIERDMRRRLIERGWLTMAWPKEYGGQEASYIKQNIYAEEMIYHEVPGRDFTAVGYLGHTLMVHGTEEQKKQHLGAIARGETTWCQGYSEPEAGSDLASLQTRAEEDGDDYIINGRKIWTTVAHLADWMFLLARTDLDAPKHRGITFFLVDLKTPGITVRPIINMVAVHNFNEVIFDNARVPKTNVVGEVNRGWYVGMTTLSFARDGITNTARCRRALDELIPYVKGTHQNGKPLAEDPVVRHKLAEMVLATEVSRLQAYRIAWLTDRGEVPQLEANFTKLFSTELLVKLSKLGMEILGLGGQLLEPEGKWTPLKGRLRRMYLWSISEVIGEGTSEIQRNIIATRGLGLPKGY